MELDSKHPTVEVLRSLLPGVQVSGGSFSSWLPDPSRLTLAECKTIIAVAQENATTKCIESLLIQNGLNPEIPVPRGPGGNREWPSGYAGSLTHKPALILGALVKKSFHTSIGIDVEVIEDGALDKDFIAPEGIPFQSNLPLGVLIAFSAKESVFKAQYPITGRRIEFSDVRIEWSESQGRLFQGRAYVHHFSSCLVQVVLSENWLVSATTY